MSFLDPGHKHTNASLRKLLGESGYIEQPKPINSAPTVVYGNASLWQRGNDRLWLIETTDMRDPWLQDARVQDGKVDPTTLGVRNINIQNDGSSDE